jgi:hypothetical protein
MVLDPLKFGAHSLRRTEATLIYRRTGNLRVVQFDILASRWTMPLMSPRKSMSKYPGRAAALCPARNGEDGLML